MTDEEKKIIDVEQLKTNVRYVLRLALFALIFFVGVFLGHKGDMNITTIMLFITFCGGCIIALGYVASMLEDDEE